METLNDQAEVEVETAVATEIEAKNEAQEI